MKTACLGALALAFCLTGCETTDVRSGELGRVLSGVIGGQTTSGALSVAEIDAGLRQALTIGTQNVARQLGRTDGYYGDPQIRIPLPTDLSRDIQSTLGNVGLSGPLDDLELRMNRAAEAAVPEARELFIGAITSMTIDDAVNILNGSDTAATDYLRRKTEAQLTSAFTPRVRNTLASSGAFTALEQVVSNYGVPGATSRLQSDLTAHAVELGTGWHISLCRGGGAQDSRRTGGAHHGAATTRFRESLLMRRFQSPIQDRRRVGRDRVW